MNKLIHSPYVWHLFGMLKILTLRVIGCVDIVKLSEGDKINKNGDKNGI